MEVNEFAKKLDTLASAISGNKGKILAYMLEHRERTYDQISLYIGESVKKDLEYLEELGFIKSHKELLHPFRLENVYSLSDRGYYYLSSLNSMFEREDIFFEAFILKLVGVIV